MRYLIILFFIFSSKLVIAQCISGNCDSGIGEKKYTDKSRFIGEFNKGEKAKGIYIYPNGDIYSGLFSKNLRTGNAIYQYSNGNVFKGEYDNNEKLYGTMYFKNGDNYHWYRKVKKS